jgi:hypothetical protein
MTIETKAFDLDDWKRRLAANAEESERNSSMDSGWSLGVAQKCERAELMLYRELVTALSNTTTNAEDFFDRPDLVALQEAARFASDPQRIASAIRGTNK